MKQLDPMPSPGLDPKGDSDGSCRPGHDSGQGDDFPACLAEALDILVNRAMRHGLVEVAHLLEVAALAARDAAASPVDRPCQPERKRDNIPSALA